MVVLFFILGNKKHKNAYLGIDHDSKSILGIFKEHNTRCKELIGIDLALGTIYFL